MVKLTQIQAGEFADLLQTVNQSIAVDKQLAGSLGNVQAVLKELVDGKQSFLIQGIQRVLLEYFTQENLAQSGGQLVNQTADAQILVVHDALFGIKYLAHFNGGLSLLVGVCQFPQMSSHGTDADNGLDPQFGLQGFFDIGSHLFPDLRQ